MNSFFICVPLTPDRNESQTDSAYAGRKAIVGSEEGTRRHWSVREDPSHYPGHYWSIWENPSHYPGQSSLSQKKTFDFLFGATLFFICFAVLGAGGRGKNSCSDSTISFCLLKVITLALCRYTGFWLKALLCHSKRKKNTKVLKCLKTASSPVINNYGELLPKCLLSSGKR